MRKYELVFLVKPELSEEDVDKLTKKVCQLIESSKGKVTSSSFMGKKVLAYPITHIKEASYVLINFENDATAIKEFSGKLKLEESIVRFLIVKV